MVIRLMPQGDPQFLKLPYSLSVDVHARLYRSGRHIVPKDVAHVVEQTAHRHQELWLVPLLLPFQNILSIGMTKRIHHPETVPGRFFVFGEVQLP